MQVQVKTILNAIQHFPGFVYEDIRMKRRRSGGPARIEITVAEHEGVPARCLIFLRKRGQEKRSSWLMFN